MPVKSPSFTIAFAIAVLSGVGISCVVGVALLASVPDVSAGVSASEPTRIETRRQIGE
jgi:hypothetical protein